jgi:hypothetical protein
MFEFTFANNIAFPGVGGAYGGGILAHFDLGTWFGAQPWRPCRPSSVVSNRRKDFFRSAVNLYRAMHMITGHEWALDKGEKDGEAEGIFCCQTRKATVVVILTGRQALVNGVTFHSSSHLFQPLAVMLSIEK